MAKQMIDLALDDLEDLAVDGGDFTIEESTAQHQRQLIMNNRGDFKQNPTFCVGVFEYMDDEHFQSLIRTISIEFMRDGMDVKTVQLNSAGIISSDAYYP